MSEARQRSLAHGSSNIFGASERPRTAAYTSPIPLVKEFTPEDFNPQREFQPKYKETDLREESYRNLYGSDRRAPMQYNNRQERSRSPT